MSCSITFLAVVVHKLALCSLYETLCSILYHLYSLKNVKNTDGGVTLLVKLQAEAHQSDQIL